MQKVFKLDNGTEGNNLLRSLATELYKDPNGRRITSTNMGPLFEDRPQEGDTQTGMIYTKNRARHRHRQGARATARCQG